MCVYTYMYRYILNYFYILCIFEYSAATGSVRNPGRSNGPRRLLLLPLPLHFTLTLTLTVTFYPYPDPHPYPHLLPLPLPFTFTRALTLTLTGLGPHCEDPGPHAWRMCAACFPSLYFPVTCNPSRAVTLPSIGALLYIGVPHRVTYP
jgi:hypothetical protein